MLLFQQSKRESLAIGGFCFPLHFFNLHNIIPGGGSRHEISKFTNLLWFV